MPPSMVFCAERYMKSGESFALGTVKWEHFTALYFRVFPLTNFQRHLIFAVWRSLFIFLHYGKGCAIMRVKYNCIIILPFLHTEHDHITFIIHNSLCLSNQKNLWLKQVFTFKNKNNILKFLFHSHCAVCSATCWRFIKRSQLQSAQDKMQLTANSVGLGPGSREYREN